MTDAPLDGPASGSGRVAAVRASGPGPTGVVPPPTALAHGPVAVRPAPEPVERVDDADPAQVATLTTRVGRVDRAADGKLALTGEDAAAFLTGQVTADVVALEPGHGTYAALLDAKGRILTDLRILRTDGELVLLCERDGLQALFDDLRRHLIGHRVELHKRTLQRTLVSLVGPGSAGALGPVAAGLGEDEHDVLAVDLDGIDVLLVRTDLGVDLLADAGDHDRLEQALDARDVPPVAVAAAEVVRVESGRPRLGAEIVSGVMPAEAGIVERAVSFTKGCYVGQETVARLHWRGRPNRHLRGVVLDRPAAPGSALLVEEREVGRLGSSVRSPRLGRIGLAIVRREVAPGDEVLVRPQDGPPTAARIVELPFDAA